MTICRRCPEGCLLMTFRLSFPFFSYKPKFGGVASALLSFILSTEDHWAGS